MRKIISIATVILLSLCIFAVMATAATTTTSPVKNPALDPANQGNAPVGGGQNRRIVFVLNEKEEPYFGTDEPTKDGDFIATPISTQNVLDVIKNRTGIEVENLGEGLFRYEEDGQRVYLTPEGVVEMYDESVYSLTFQSEEPVKRTTTVRKVTKDDSIIETLQEQTKSIQHIKTGFVYLLILIGLATIFTVFSFSHLEKELDTLWNKYRALETKFDEYEKEKK